MLTHQETIESDYEKRKIALEAALRVGCGVGDGEFGYEPKTDGSIVVKNAELFLEFLNKDAVNG